MTHKPGEIRIIGGQWRGRKIKVPDLPELRPTPNRIRETLFNWLTDIIPNAYCLDAFAGAGALGFEALSRGAATVTMVDKSPAIIQHLKAEAAKFKIQNLEIYLAEMPFQLKIPKQRFNVVFLDPPFQSDLLSKTSDYLEQKKFLAKDCYIYLESATNLTENDLPSGWKILKNKKAGHVAYHLVKRIL